MTQAQMSDDVGPPGDGSGHQPDAPDRTGAQWWPYALAAVAYLLAPFVLGATLPAAAATTALLILLPAAALLLGVIDAVVFRRTWAFPGLTGILCLLGLAMYTNDGTWIYALGVVALSRLGGALGGRRRAQG